jgi:arylsulfatase A-like enzyme
VTCRIFLSAQIAGVAITALVIGFLDAAMVAMGIAGARGAFQFVPARIWIVSPAVWMAIAVVIGSVVLPLRKRWGGLVVAATLIVIFVTIRLRTHPVVLLVVLSVIGGALWTVRPAMHRWMGRPRRLTAGGLIGTTIGLALTATMLPERHATNGARGGGSGPNVIVIFLDTVRYDALFDDEGRAREDLPTVTKVRRESTVFTRAYASAPWTLPSHLSALTGLPAHALGVSFDSQVYRRSDPTLAERFRRRGYRTAAVISNSFLNAGTGVARGFDTFDQAQTGLDLCRTAPGLLADTSWPWFSAAVCNWTASRVTRRGLSLMDDRKGPFFLMLNYMDAHEPYYVEASCGAAGGYRAAIRCLDRNLAPIVDWRSPRRPTVLAIVGDHGEQFGEHGLTRHGNSLYVQLLHVPLLIRTADAAPRLRTTPLSIASLPTLLDNSADDPEIDAPLTALLDPPAASRRPLEWSALDRDWHLIVREHGNDALYYLPADPAETRNRIGEVGGNPAIARLRAAIERMRATPKPDLSRFRSLGYLQ